MFESNDPLEWSDDSDDPGFLWEEAGVTRADLLKYGAGAAAAGALLGGAERASAWSAATPRPKYGGILRYGIAHGNAATSLDPATETHPDQRIPMTLVYERLVTLGNDMKPIPELATKWVPNKTATVWTFSLRRGVKFSDGTPFGAKDVAWSISQMLDRTRPTQLFSRLSKSLDPSGIKVINDLTVRLELKRPDAVLPIVFGQRGSNMYKNGVNPKTVAQSIGTGPFILVSWVATQTWEVRRNPNYWRKGPDGRRLPYLDGVQGIRLDNEATRLAALNAGSIDIGENVDPAGKASLDLGKIKLLTLSGAHPYYMAMDRTAKPFDDVRVVEAIKLAQDRKKVVKTVWGGQGTITADVFIGPRDPAYPKGIRVARDVKKAKQLLAAAGYPRGLEIELYTTNLAGFVSLASLYQEMLKDIGIDVKITQAPSPTYYSQVWTKKPCCITQTFRKPATDMLPLRFTSDAQVNDTKFKNNILDRLVKEAYGILDDDERNKILRRAYRIQATRAGSALCAFVNWQLPARKNVYGVRPSYELALDLRNAWLA